MRSQPARPEHGHVGARQAGDSVLTAQPNIRSTTPGAFNFAVGAEPSPGYRLQRVRGRGGFAEVWEAESPNGPHVALKFMPSSNMSTTARELRSVQSFQSLEHPYIVKTYGMWSVPGYIVINMELAEATLLDLMHLYHDDLGQPIDPAVLCLYLSQVAEALDFLNARRHVLAGRKVGFQHGDVKPNNILLFGDIAKLTDHGLATPTYGPTTPCPRQGTREYAAPEVFLGSLSDFSDQYSLAVTYYALRAGRFPFPPPPKDTSRSYNRPLADLSGVTEAERPALIRALAPVPTHRFPNCREFMSALLKSLGLRVEKVDDETHQVRVVREGVKPGSKLHQRKLPG
jgi:serine/threonine protein kinase, bacterial